MLEFYESFQKCDIPKSLANLVYDTNGQLQLIEELNKVNVFIGANNSGKSLILREILRDKRNKYYGETRKKQITDLLEKILDKLSVLHSSVGVGCVEVKIQNSQSTVYNFGMFNTARRNELLEIGANCDISSKITTISTLILQHPYALKQYEGLHLFLGPNKGYNIADKNQRDSFAEALNDLRMTVPIVFKELEKFIFPDSSKNLQIYIPSIRTLRPFASATKLKGLTELEYSFESLIVHNGEELPQTIQDLRIGEHEEREKLERFQNFLSEEFFDKKSIVLNLPPKAKNSSMTIKIGDEKERPIYELGDGLQMIIILTFPFFNYEKGFVVIEEPELFIHPGLQKRLVNFFCTHKLTENFQIFIATHSNHIIDSISLTSKASLFTVKKKNKEGDNSKNKISDFLLENVANGKETILKLLGITNSSVYLSNSTIWVEGITDKLYIQKYISEYIKQSDLKEEFKDCKNFQEGLHYSFSLTGGDSIVHWNFDEESEYEEYTKSIIVYKFCSKSFLIVDNDFGKNTKRKEALVKLLNDRFYELNCPEIENLLTEDIIKKTIMEYSTVKNAVDTNILPDLKSDILTKNKLGYVIDEILLKDFPKAKKFSNASKEGKKSGLKSADKFDFCTIALDHIQYKTMSNEAKELVEKLLRFVKSQNL
jgi:predicted ATPase